MTCAPSTGPGPTTVIEDSTIHRSVHAARRRHLVYTGHMIVRTLRHLTAMLFASLLLCLSWVAPAAADVENFDYAGWHLTYEIALDDEGRAHAEVTEELTARFPQEDQNRGIIRSLPQRYQGAPAAPEAVHVTDEYGTALPFEIEDDNGLRNILIGDDSFVHGAQTYIITYTVSDVMHTTGKLDEFYWDLIPADRAQSVDDVTARIGFDQKLTAALTDDAACYVGTPEDSQPCLLHRSQDDPAVVTVAHENLPGGHGLTIAVGATGGTVTQPPERQENFVLDVLPILLAGAALLISSGGFLGVVRMIRRRRNADRYPGALSSQSSSGADHRIGPLLAAQFIGKTREPIVATILDFAVRGVLRIEETPDGKDTKPVLRLLDAQLVTDPVEHTLLVGMFPELQPGDTFDFPVDNEAYETAVADATRQAADAAIDRGYQFKRRHRGAVAAGIISLALLAGAVVVLVLGASRENEAMQVTSVLLTMIAGVLAVGCLLRYRLLTPQGAAARRQLERLRHALDSGQIRQVEALQSAATAPRRSTESGDHTVQLYDAALPWAVLFGQQKSWTTVMAQAYQHHHWPAPLWYPVIFSSTRSPDAALNSMLSSISNAATTASSTPGSTGGGAVGGGGGGGAAGGR